MPPDHATAGDAAPVRVVYLSGTGRSGTTLIGNAVGSLAGAISVGEVKYGIRRGLAEGGHCGCRELVTECPVWVPALEATFGAVPSPEQAIELDNRLSAAVRTRQVPHWLRGRPDEEETELIDLFGRLARNVAQVSGASSIVDSSKLPAFGALLSQHPGLDVFVLNVVRDPRAVAWSWQRAQASNQMNGYEEEMERFSVTKSSAMWLESSVSTSALANRSGRPSLTVRYEDFVRAPSVQLRRIADFAGIPQTDLGSLIDEDGLHLARSHAIAGNPNRVRSGPIRLTLDSEWERSLPARQRRLVSTLTAPRRRTYGY